MEADLGQSDHCRYYETENFVLMLLCVKEKPNLNICFLFEISCMDIFMPRIIIIIAKCLPRIIDAI